IPARQGRVGQHPDRRPSARRPSAARPATGGRLPAAGPRQVLWPVRRRPAGRAGRVHGRRPSPLGVNALGGSITDPAWWTKPSWYLVATEDRMIPPPARRLMSERAGSTCRPTTTCAPTPTAPCPATDRGRWQLGGRLETFTWGSTPATALPSAWGSTFRRP